jgi:hypothetical protein
MEVSGLDLPEEDVLDLAGSERGFGSHTEWSERATDAGAVQLVKIITRPFGKQLSLPGTLLDHLAENRSRASN